MTTKRIVAALLAALVLLFFVPAPSAQAQYRRHRGGDDYSRLVDDNLAYVYGQGGHDRRDGGHGYRRREHRNDNWSWRGHDRGRRRHDGQVLGRVLDILQLGTSAWGALEARGARRAAERMERGNDQEAPQVIIVNWADARAEAEQSSESAQESRPEQIPHQGLVRIRNATGCQVAVHQSGGRRDILNPKGEIYLPASSVAGVWVTGNFILRDGSTQMLRAPVAPDTVEPGVWVITHPQKEG